MKEKYESEGFDEQRLAIQDMTKGRNLMISFNSDILNRKFG